MFAFAHGRGKGRAFVLACTVLAGCSTRAVPVDQGSGDEETTAVGSHTGGGSGEGSAGTTGPGDGDGDGDGEWTDGGTQFVPPSDYLEPPICDIWGDDCPDGEKCTAYATAGSSWDANKCVPVMGDDKHGEPCQAFESGVSGLDTCEKGAMCWDVDPDTLIGYCLDFCSGSVNDPQCPDGTVCPIYSNGVLVLCQPMCDPLAPTTDCPNPDSLCVSAPGGEGFMCILDASGGQGSFGTECQYTNSCNYGLFCAGAEAVPDCQGSQGCCTPYCDLNQPDCPPDLGLECVPWWEEGQAPAGFEHVGGCVIPE